MTKMKKIAMSTALASCLALSSVTAIASAESILTPPVDWIAVNAQGAPSSVNRTYYYPIYTYGNGYDITCTFMYGDYDQNIESRIQYDVDILGIISSCDDFVVDFHRTTSSPYFVENPNGIIGNSITFSFKTTCTNNCNGGGVLSYH